VTYQEISNEELTRLLHERYPALAEHGPVTDETRNTAIAMLSVDL
jgi:hypothetical protein